MWHAWGGEKCLQFFFGRPKGKRPLGRPRHRWEDNIKLDLRRQESMVRTGFSWLRVGSSGGLV
jgi:hypothetical protein